MNTRVTYKRERRRRGLTVGLTVLLALVGTACDSIIEVRLGDRVEEATLEGPDAAALLATSVQATFECAYSSYAHVMGLFADELNSIPALRAGS